MDNTKIDLHLCAGYDGIGRGLELAGVEPPHGTIYVEIEAFACANLVAKIEAGELGPAVCHSDLKNFPYKDLAGHVRILTAGFPCQPFSQAGVRKGTEDPRHLWPHIARGISECRPEVVFCENVDGIVISKTADGESVLKYVLRSLEEMGYRATAGCFSAAEVGAPHQRRRWFILAHSQSWGTRRELGNRIGEGENFQSGCCGGQGDKLAHNNNERLEGGDERSSQELYKEGWESKRQVEFRGGFQWPSRPGQDQFHWEAPRATQPGLGRATNGPDFRVDRLRLLGNGVVPQTAARAFIHLLDEVMG